MSRAENIFKSECYHSGGVKRYSDKRTHYTNKKVLILQINIFYVLEAHFLKYYRISRW